MDLNNNRTKPSANKATASATSRQKPPNFKSTTSKGPAPSFTTSQLSSPKGKIVQPLNIGPPPNLPPKNPKYAHVTSKFMLPPPPPTIELPKPTTVTPSKYKTTNRSIPKPPNAKSTTSKRSTPSFTTSKLSSSKGKIVQPLNIGPPPKLPPKNPKYAHVTSKFMLPPPPPTIELPKPTTVAPSKYKTTNRSIPKSPLVKSTTSKGCPHGSTTSKLSSLKGEIVRPLSIGPPPTLPPKNPKYTHVTSKFMISPSPPTIELPKPTTVTSSKYKTTNRNIPKPPLVQSTTSKGCPPSFTTSKLSSSKGKSVQPLNIGPPPNLPPKNPKYAHVTSKYMLPSAPTTIELPKRTAVTPSKYKTTNRSIPKRPLDEKTPVKSVKKRKKLPLDDSDDDSDPGPPFPFFDKYAKPTDLTKGFKFPPGFLDKYKKRPQSNTAKDNVPNKPERTYNPPKYNSLKYEPPEHCKPKPKPDGPPSPKPPKRVPYRYCRDPIVIVPKPNVKGKFKGKFKANIPMPIDDRTEEDYLEMFCENVFNRRRPKKEPYYEKKRYKFTVNRRGLPHQLPAKNLLKKDHHVSDFLDVLLFMF